jgi:hypothetical protein
MRIRRALVTLVGATSLLLVTQATESSALARCDHGNHSHGGGASWWHFHSHAGSNPHVHLMHDHVSGNYDTANC